MICVIFSSVYLKTQSRGAEKPSFSGFVSVKVVSCRLKCTITASPAVITMRKSLDSFPLPSHVGIRLCSGAFGAQDFAIIQPANCRTFLCLKKHNLAVNETSVFFNVELVSRRKNCHFGDVPCLGIPKDFRFQLRFDLWGLRSLL